MPRKITSGTLGRQVLGNIVTENNTLQSVVTNTSIVLEPNGTGVVETTTDLKISNNSDLILTSNNANNVGIKAPTSLAATYTLTMPPNDGNTGQALTTNGSGTLTWENTGVTVTNEVADGSVPYYPILTTNTSGSISGVNTSSTKISFSPNSGNLTTAGSISCVGVAAGSGSISTTGSASVGSLTVATTGAASFGSATRQMLNLYGTNYGIGVQSNTLYFRTDTEFSWHRDGVHNDNENNAGAGGTNVMNLDANGHLLPGANGSQDLGGNSNRWRTIYTTDLELSNGIGDYTVVEGEEDLFLYNNKNGKTYKFVIQEVDPTIVPPKDAMNANKE